MTVTYKYAEFENLLIVFQEDFDVDGSEIETGVWLTTHSGLKDACTKIQTHDLITAYVPLSNGKVPKNTNSIRRDSILDNCDYNSCKHDISTGCSLFQAWKHLEEYGCLTTVERILKIRAEVKEVVDMWGGNKLFHSLSLSEAYSMIKEVDIFEVEIKYNIKIKKIIEE